VSSIDLSGELVCLDETVANEKSPTTHAQFTCTSIVRLWRYRDAHCASASLGYLLSCSLERLGLLRPLSGGRSHGPFGWRLLPHAALDHTCRSQVAGFQRKKSLGKEILRPRYFATPQVLSASELSR